MGTLSEFLSPYIERVECDNLIGANVSSEIKRPYRLIAFDSKSVEQHPTLLWKDTEPVVCLWMNGAYYDNVCELNHKRFGYYSYSEFQFVEYGDESWEVDTFAIVNDLDKDRLVAYYNTNGLVLDDMVGKSVCYE